MHGCPGIPQFLLSRKEPKDCAGKVHRGTPGADPQLWARHSKLPPHRQKCHSGVPALLLLGEPNFQAHAGHGEHSTQMHLVGMQHKQKRSRTRADIACLCSLACPSHLIAIQRIGKVRPEQEDTQTPVPASQLPAVQQSTQMNSDLVNFQVTK